jgi:hypothetical protein
MPSRRQRARRRPEPTLAALHRQQHRPVGQARRRAAYIALGCSAIAIGLAVHWRGDVLDPAVRDIAGDGLWAAMMLCWIGAVVPGASLRARAGAALLICFAVEFSQLYRTPALDRLRATTAGHLLLGSDFDVRDLMAYAIGVFALAAAEYAAKRAAGHRPGDPGEYP